MKKISIKGASWDSIILSVTKIITLLFNILSSKILSTGLSLYEYGTYSQANLIMTTGASLILFGLGDALNYYFNKKSKEFAEEEKERIINTVFLIEIVFGLFFWIIIFFGGNFISEYFKNQSLTGSLFIVALLPVFSNLIYFMQILCVSVSKAKKMALYGLLFTFLRIVAVWLSVCMLNNIVWIYFATLLIDILNIVLYYLDLKKSNIKINLFKISKKHIISILNYALPMGVFAITNTFTRELDKLVIGYFGGTEELAIYSNCSKILPLDFFVTSFAVVLIPFIYRRVSEKKHKESVDLFSSYLKIGYYTVWILGVAILVAPKSVISFLYADIYTVGEPIFVIYIFDSMIKFASIHLVLTSAGKSKNVMIYSVISLIINLALNIVLYYIFGMIGPAVSTLIVSILYMLLILRDTIRTINSKWSEVFNFRDLIIFVVSLITIWFISFSINKILLAIGIHIYLSMFISIFVFLLFIGIINYKKILFVLKKINSFKL